MANQLELVLLPLLYLLLLPAFVFEFVAALNILPLVVCWLLHFSCSFRGAPKATAMEDEG